MSPDEHRLAVPEAPHPPVSPGRHRRDTVVTTAVGLFTYGLSLLSGPLLARSLGAADRGSYQAVWTPTQVLGWLLMFGVPAATAYYARDKDRRGLDANAWLVTVAVGVPVVAVLWPLVPLFLAKHPPETVGWFRWFLVAALLVLPMQNSFEYLRARGANWRFNVYRSLPLLLTTVFVAGLFALGRLNLATALGATLAANVVGPLAVIVLERSWPWLAWRRVERRLLRHQLHYGGRVWFGTLSNMVLARFDQFLMVGLVAPAQLGLYAVAVTAAGLSAPLAQGVGFALFPYLRAEDDQRARSARTWVALRWVGLGSVLICGGLAVAGPWGLPALMGEEFRGALTAFWVLLPGQLLWNLGQVAKTKLEADNRPGVASGCLALAAVITVIGVPMAVPHWGIVGAAAVTVVAQGAFCVSGFWLALRGSGRRSSASMLAG